MGEATVRATGSFGFDQSLDFTGRVTFSRTKTAELTRRAGELRNLRNADGELELPLTITGTASAPNIEVSLSRMLETAAKYQLKRQLDKTLKGLIKRR